MVPAQKQQLLRTFHAESLVTCVAWSPDGCKLAYGSGDGVACVLEPSVGVVVQTYGGHLGYRVKGVAFSPDGSRVASVGNDHMLHVWNPSTGTSFLTAHISLDFSPMTGFLLSLNAVAWSPDGRELVTACRNGKAQIWNANTGTLPLLIRLPSPLMDNVSRLPVTTQRFRFGMFAQAKGASPIPGTQMRCGRWPGPL